MTDQGALRRIRALLRLADKDRGGTPAERQAALTKARALAARHQVQIENLDLDGEDPGSQPGELVVDLDEKHPVWAAMLLDGIAHPLGVQTYPHQLHSRRLAGPAAAVAQAARAHRDAYAAILAAHTHLIAGLTTDARRARRFLNARYPNRDLQQLVVAQLRYTDPERLAADIADTLALKSSAARTTARALLAGNVAAIDTDPDTVEIPYFVGAIDAVSQRLRELQHHRHPQQPAPAAESLGEDLAPQRVEPAPTPRRSGRRVAWDPSAHRAGAHAAASAPIGLVDVA